MINNKNNSILAKPTIATKDNAHHKIQPYKDHWERGVNVYIYRIGTRPSVHGKEYRLEVHLPQFQGDLYDLTLTVIFTKYLHAEVYYKSLDDLKQGIQNDINQLLSQHNP